MKNERADFMFEGYIRVAAATPIIRIADCSYNAAQILELIKKADREQVHILCLPELCITGYTCGDLFLQDTLLDSAKAALRFLIKESEGYNVLVMAGLPLVQNGKLYNVAAVFCSGQLLGFVPKTHIPNDRDFNETRHFTAASIHMKYTQYIVFDNREYIFDTRLLFQCEDMPEFSVAVEICEDLWSPCPPSAHHAMAGALVIANLSASPEMIGKAAYRRSSISGQSGRLMCAYVYANAGYGESTTDMVFSGHNLICENGAILQEAPPFGNGWAVSEIDLLALSHDRRQKHTFSSIIEGNNIIEGYVTIPFSLDAQCASLHRFINPAPFIPQDKAERQVRCEEILNVQAAALAKRLDHTDSQSLVLGISGGLDSSLALLAVVKSCEVAGKPVSGSLAVTMPCFGTTERTKHNAHSLCEALGIPCREIDISQSVTQHLLDIEHPDDKEDIVFENAQARMRTLVLMDLANQQNGMVIGTGNLSELALGWATYNGDHMSMYGINSGIPKTLVRHIVKYVADTCDNARLSAVLLDILDTPVSPELLSPKQGEIIQHTENLVGPYALHDFFLYHVVRWGRRPGTIFHLACAAFEEDYPSTVILKWLNVFYRRFFTQQFKRSCLPDGPKIGSVSFSPRGAWKVPSDAVCSAWVEELEGLEQLRSEV